MNQLSYTFHSLTPQEAEVIVAGLRELPMKISEPLVQKLRQQFHEQTTAFVESQQAAAAAGKKQEGESAPA